MEGASSASLGAHGLRARRHRISIALMAALAFTIPVTAAPPRPVDMRYDIRSYPLAPGTHLEIEGTWILVGKYTLTFKEAGIPPINYAVREIARIRSTKTPTIGQLQVCGFMTDWNLQQEITTYSANHSYANGVYQFVRRSPKEMDVRVNFKDNDGFQLQGEMQAHKINRNPSQPVGDIVLSATSFDDENFESPSSIPLFTNDRFPVSCFAEMKSDDKGGPSMLNVFTAIVKTLPKANVVRRHYLKAAFANHELTFNSEEVQIKGQCCAEGHSASLQKDVALIGEDALPSKNEVHAFGGGPGVVISNLYSTQQRLESTFHFDASSVPDIKVEANGTIILDALNPP